MSNNPPANPANPYKYVAPLCPYQVEIHPQDVDPWFDSISWMPLVDLQKGNVNLDAFSGSTMASGFEVSFPENRQKSFPLHPS